MKVSVKKPDASIKKAVRMARNKQLTGSLNSEYHSKFSHVSHSIEKITVHPTTLSLEVQVLETPEGKVLKELLEAGLGLQFLPIVTREGILETFNVYPVEKTLTEKIREQPAKRGYLVSKELGIL